MQAFFCIDKAPWCTSFDVIRSMRRILSTRKIWHSGTLDPLATGLLLVACGSYTKLLPYLHADRKTYKAHIKLDGCSPSFDRDTDISYLPKHIQEQAQKNCHLEDILACISQYFLWEISQVPPVYSALKIQGKKAVDRVRAGEKIEMKARKSHIYDFEILSYRYPNLHARIEVSAGTYIRSLAHDLGEKLGYAWYIQELRRTHVRNLQVDDAVSLDTLSWDRCVSEKNIFWSQLVGCDDDNLYTRLTSGQRVRREYNWDKNIPLFLYDGKTIRFVVLYRDGVVHPVKYIS